MSQPYVVGQPPRSGRGPTFWILLSLGGCALVGVVLCLALSVFGALTARFFGDELEKASTPVHSWTEAAAKTSMDVYEPAYVPEDAGTPEIIVFGLGGLFQTATGQYPNGLQIMESNQDIGSGAGRESVTVNGADEAFWTTATGNRTLAVRRGKTWVNLSGLYNDDELIRIAESLRLVEG